MNYLVTKTETTYRNGRLISNEISNWVIADEDVSFLEERLLQWHYLFQEDTKTWVRLGSKDYNGTDKQFFITPITKTVNLFDIKL